MKTTSSENFKNDSLSFEEFQEAIEKRIKAAIHHEQAAEV